MKIDESWYRKPTGIPTKASAGGVVARVQDGRVLLAFVREGSKPGLVLPKGRVEGNESLAETARREIEEEAGLNDLKLITKLGTRERLDFSKRLWKQVHYFLFTTDQKSGKPTDPKHRHYVEWFPLDQLPQMFWPEQRELIESNRERIRQLAVTAAAE